jgi:hypothetical protein
MCKKCRRESEYMCTHHISWENYFSRGSSVASLNWGASKEVANCAAHETYVGTQNSLYMARIICSKSLALESFRSSCGSFRLLKRKGSSSSGTPLDEMQRFLFPNTANLLLFNLAFGALLCSRMQDDVRREGRPRVSARLLIIFPLLETKRCWWMVIDYLSPLLFKRINLLAFKRCAPH